MRDIIVSLVIFGLMPVCFRRPFVGLIVFSWLAYMRVQDLSWGFARHIRWSFYISVIMFTGFLFAKERKRFFVPDKRCWFMLLMVVILAIGILDSRGPKAGAFNRYIEFVKIVAIALFTTGIVTNRERLRVLVWTIALSLGFFGVKSGLWGIFSLGSTQILRGPGGMLQDNNDFSLALSMAVPMLFELGWTERRPEIRKAFWFALPLTVITVGLTHSRGGFLSVTAALGVLVWRSRNRFAGMMVGLLVAIAGFLIAPADYKERISTIFNPSEEGSASSRLRAWGIATRMALDNPWLGVGFAKFPWHFVEYAEDPTPHELSGRGLIVAHSSYFQVWAECGTPALLIYVGLILGSFITCWSVRKEARRRYYSSWIINYATMFEASLVAFVVGAAFLNRAHFDLFYHWVALILVFGNIARDEMRNVTVYPVRGDQRDPVQHVRKTGFDRPRLSSGFVPQGAR